MTDLDDIIARHPRSEGVGGLTGQPFCEGDHDTSTYWPCETVQLAVRARDAEQKVAAVWDEGWRARPNARYVAGYVDPKGNPYRAALSGDDDQPTTP